MIVCVCNNISDHQIKSAIVEGVCTFEELRMKLGVSSNCGICADVVMDLLEQRREDSHEVEPGIDSPKTS